MAMDDPMMENASNTLSNNKSLNKRTPSVHNSVSNRQNMMEIQHDNNNPIHEGMYEGGQPNYNYKIPQIKGEKTIICWNCNTVLLIKEEWNVVQCTNCEKINRVPNANIDANKQIKINDNLNHFELYLPYVYIIVTCPFCKTDNKARKDAEHMVCYKCHNSISIQKDSKTDYGSSQAQAGGGMNNYMLPSKSMRFSDMFFPDPMFYPGYYPMGGGQYNPYNPYMNHRMPYDPYNDPYNNDLDYLYKKKVKFDIMKNKLKLDNYKSKVKSENRTEDPLSGRYKAIKGLLDHHDMLVNKKSNNTAESSSLADKFINNHFDSALKYGSSNIGSNYPSTIIGNKYSYNNNRTPNKEKGNIIYKNMFTPNKSNYNN